LNISAIDATIMAAAVASVELIDRISNTSEISMNCTDPTAKDEQQ
jgi:hypothetical protein